jgi:hypothetical protein
MTAGVQAKSRDPWDPTPFTVCPGCGSRFADVHRCCMRPETGRK